jgi:hypothetical protein
MHSRSVAPTTIDWNEDEAMGLPLSLCMFVELIFASASRYWLRMDKSAKCQSCGGKVALGRCLGCGAYPRSRRWWIIPALAIFALAALDALMGDGQQHISTLTSVFGPVQ